MSTNRQIARGAGWLLLGRVLDKSLGLVSTLVLARLLAPEDFGLVAIVTSVVTFLDLLTQFSLDLTLIRHPSPNREHYDSAWTLNLLFSAAIALSLVLFAYPAAHFYGDRRIIGIALAIAPCALLQGALNVGLVQFRRELKFEKEFQFVVLRRSISAPITIGLAIVMRDYWALVIGSLNSAVVAVALSYWMHPFRPRFTLRRARELLGFSKWLFLNNLLNYAFSQFPDLIIGRASGARALGLYRLSVEFATMLTGEFVAAVNRAAFPGYAKLGTQKQQLSDTYLLLTGTVCVCSLPIGVGLALVAPYLIPLLFGPKWSDAVPLFQLCAIGGGVHAIWSNTGYVFLALQEPKRAAMLLSIHACTMLSVLSILLALDVRNAPGWALLATAAVVSIASPVMVASRLALDYKNFLYVLWRPAVSAAIMSAAMFFLTDLLPTPTDSLGTLIPALAAEVLFGAVIYVSVLIALWRASGSPRGGEAVLWALVSSRFRKRNV